MAKVSLKGIPELEKSIEDTFKKVTEGKQMRDEVGTFLRDRLKSEARRARPLNDSRAFPPLKQTSIIIRESLARTNETHITYKSTRSNLTFSGQLIDAIRYFLTSTKIIIEVENTARAPYRTRDRLSTKELGGLRGSIGNLKATSEFIKRTRTTGQDSPPPTNKELDQDLRRRGFVLYTAQGIESDDRVLRRINNIVKKFVRRAIKINFGS